MISDLEKFQTVIGYRFQNSDLLKQALIHPSYSGEMNMQRYESNQRLEFLGDAVLGLTVADNGLSLQSDVVWIEDRGVLVPDSAVHVTPRIGVDYAGEDALLPYRFCLDLSDYK